MYLSACGQEKPLDMKMDFEEYDPPIISRRSRAQTYTREVSIHRCPHHQFNMTSQDLSELTKEMDKLNMAVMVNLSGRGRGSTEHLEKIP
jgi:hypothetical protein